MKINLIIIYMTLLSLALPFAIASHADEPTTPHISAEWQIWAYTTAAPSFIGNTAKVLDASNEVLREGNNGWTCMPGNARPMPEAGWPSAHQAMPVCADVESLKWMQAYLSEEKPELMRVWLQLGYQDGSDHVRGLAG